MEESFEEELEEEADEESKNGSNQANRERSQKLNDSKEKYPANRLLGTLASID